MVIAAFLVFTTSKTYILAPTEKHHLRRPEKESFMKRSLVAVITMVLVAPLTSADVQGRAGMRTCFS
jgi:hypothetical protein